MHGDTNVKFMLVFVSKGLINTAGPLHVSYDFLIQSDKKICACVLPLFLFVDPYAEAFMVFMVHFLLFLMSTLISPTEFMSLTFIGSVVSRAYRSLPT